MLELKHVSKKFQQTEILSNINLTFDDGVYGLLAPNGAGKTTLIKMITTLLFPTEGEIFWNGQEIQSLGANYRGTLGYLPQDFGYYGNYSPVKFLKYIGTLQQMDKKTTLKRIDELLELVALTEVKHKKMKKFSGACSNGWGLLKQC